MRSLFLAAFAVFAFLNLNAQGDDDHGPIQEGKWQIEINTGSWTTGSTAFSLTSVDGETMWSVGGEGGYFVADDLAIKAGLGYSDFGDDFSSFSYKIGAKYYINSEFPVGLDFTGTSFKDFDENPSYVGIEGGYAWFITQKVSVEPKLRYNISMNSDFYDDALQVLIGFAIHL
ncbi:hypothetical protein [Winogradskyella ouciana]|uniref:Outer membrane protein beta-barrel domain-containing protein n=1 Tax=Winogradskyella ouciana TaxID=2608631 RepID=A0A7K1G9F0_9FLAO|nr:hypothetical protein [Winogradskyella ouciana]MTE25900.1 hypothetical protein [Winogradskyella ouciana]